LILSDTLGMKPYSIDLRSRVLEAVDLGVPRKEVAKTFSVSLPSIKRWLKLRKETGSLEPRKGVPGPPARKGAALRAYGYRDSSRLIPTSPFKSTARLSKMSRPR
jgi:hypothetical protein